MKKIELVAAFAARHLLRIAKHKQEHPDMPPIERKVCYQQAMFCHLAMGFHDLTSLRDVPDVEPGVFDSIEGVVHDFPEKDPWDLFKGYINYSLRRLTDCVSAAKLFGKHTEAVELSTLGMCLSLMMCDLIVVADPEDETHKSETARLAKRDMPPVVYKFRIDTTPLEEAKS